MANREMLVCVEVPTDERAELAVGALEQYTPIEAKVVAAAEEPNR